MILINIKAGVLHDSAILKVFKIVGFHGIILIELFKKFLQIMDRLLDKEVHQLYKAPSLVNYLGVKTSSSHASSTASGNAGTSPNPQACGGVAEPPGSSRAGSSAPSGGASAQPAVLTASDVNPAPNRTAVGARPKITYPLRYNRYVSILVVSVTRVCQGAC